MQSDEIGGLASEVSHALFDQNQRLPVLDVRQVLPVVETNMKVADQETLAHKFGCVSNAFPLLIELGVKQREVEAWVPRSPKLQQSNFVQVVVVGGASPIEQARHTTGIHINVAIDEVAMNHAFGRFDIGEASH